MDPTDAQFQAYNSSTCALCPGFTTTLSSRSQCTAFAKLPESLSSDGSFEGAAALSESAALSEVAQLELSGTALSEAALRERGLERGGGLARVARSAAALSEQFEQWPWEAVRNSGSNGDLVVEQSNSSAPMR
eukprot:CAMPEP_0174694726 /NCGR_PEP_ID=MMETSP1094-20130205/1262_1 /TAXON_ID=156173 /ORGANISM="Chrysochromulina brevifilum, Strain UTEX LB 985" /LENGTH=132 /DNA_ID=CAMNT_0015891043 /DNA_START=127 /DNA_END=528 /DNA_ORIENTATION=+